MIAASRASVHITAMLCLWSRREYGSWDRSRGGGEDVTEAWVSVVEALPFGGEASPFVGGSGEVLEFRMEPNSVAGSAGKAAEGSDGDRGVLKVSRMLGKECERAG